eukprot:IDg8642t1
MNPKKNAPGAAEGPVKFKANPPDLFGGKRDFLEVNTWLYKMEQYFRIVELFSPGFLSNGADRVMIASTFLTETAAIWWYTRVQGGLLPSTWEDFCLALKNEFVPAGHVRQARDKLRRLKQSRSVSRYLSSFRNVILTIPDITEGEKMDKFVDGLKDELRIE